NPSANATKTTIDNAGSVGCAIPPLTTGDRLGINNGMQQTVLDEVINIFPDKFASSGTIDVKQTDQSTGVESTVYSWHGWKVAVPVVDPGTGGSGCPVAWSPFKGTVLARLWDSAFSCGLVSPAFADPLNQNMTIIGWTQFVITQIVNGNPGCIVNN